MIRSIIEETGAQIDVSDDGVVSIATASGEAMARAKEIINSLTADVEIGKVYEGKIVKEMPFGYFVEIFPGKEGLCHISEISSKRLETIQEAGFKEGDPLSVIVLEVDDKTGKIKLSHKRVMETAKA